MMAVTSITTVLSPLEDFTPQTQDGLAMLSVDTEARSGRSLANHTPLRTSFTAPKDARLRFSFALIPALRRPNQAPAITMHLRCEGEDPLTKRYVLENRMNAPLTWHNQSLDLAPYEGREVQVEFQLVLHPDCNEEGWAFVAEPMVSVQGMDAPHHPVDYQRHPPGGPHGQRGSGANTLSGCPRQARDFLRGRL